ncbi:hypothetical protein V6R21_10495 [Limibacter armeniacum]|uniref:hypothetical protein n=1 Tax=Limibacter armeniacum TaxID=466084 RepID=UPI002FE61C56
MSKVIFEEWNNNYFERTTFNQICYTMKPYLNILIICLLVLLGCTPTKMTTSWQNPKIKEPAYENVFVAALTENMGIRQRVENEIAYQIQKEGGAAGPSAELFPPKLDGHMPQDKNVILEKVRAAGFDSILTVALVDSKNETRYVPGAAGYAPMGMYGYYGTFGGYYGYRYPYAYSPGYYTQDKVYFMEANLYDVATEQLVWSAQSEFYNPSDLESFANDFADRVSNSLRWDRLIAIKK